LSSRVKMYDTAVWNRLEKRWVREGKRLPKKAAENRLGYRRRYSPAAEFKMVTVYVKAPQ
jgi:hypothetical protein